eukprot:1552903-Prymnesium_polylepis.1
MATFSELVQAKARIVQKEVKLSRLKAHDPGTLTTLIRSLLRPLPSIQAQIDEFSCREDVPSCVGLHVRRTDHLSTAEHRGG